MPEIVENKRKHLISWLVMGALLGLTAYFLFRDNELPKVAEALSGVRPVFLLPALLTMAAFFACEAINLQMICRVNGYRLPFRRFYAYSLMGFYFSAITPACSGGQPSQVYFMNKDGIPPGVSSLSLLLFNLTYHMAVLLIAIGSFFLGGIRIVAGLPGLQYLLLYGVIVQGALVLLFVAAVFSPRIAPAIVGGVINFLSRLRILRQKEQALAKAEEILSEYRRGADYLRGKPSLLLKTLLITIIHLLLFYSLIFWVSQALGLSGPGFWVLISVQAALTLALESLPIPGSLGLAEKSYLVVY
jgi:uncharacterized protein (TIRG00374 family)